MYYFIFDDGFGDVNGDLGTRRDWSIVLQVFVTLGAGVVFGELSILNVPGSKVQKGGGGTAD